MKLANPQTEYPSLSQAAKQRQSEYRAEC